MIVERLPSSVSPTLYTQLTDPSALDRRQITADRLLAADGAGHLVHDLPMRLDGRTATVESRPWRLDPIPAVLDSATFSWLSGAIAERLEGIELVLDDLYGDRNLVRERIIAAEGLAATPSYRFNAVGSRPRRWLTTYAVDLALDTDGNWSVVQDLTDTPSGIGYALLNRSVMSRVVPRIIKTADVASLARFSGVMRNALASLSSATSPRTVLFSGGLDHPAFVDHSYLAVQLGINLVEGADLVVRQNKVWLRTLDGLEPVDVLYRRISSRAIDPLEIGAVGRSGIPGLIQAVRAGGVTLANANGSGIAEMSVVADHLDAAIERVVGAAPRLAARNSAGAATPIAEVPLRPGSVSPTLNSTPVILRMFAVNNGERISVMPGASARLIFAGDDPRRPTACAAKDVWVLGSTTGPTVGVRLPQVDFGRSVPTRAAEALYWCNRSAERAEALARTLRVISIRLEDPGLTGMHGGRWTAQMCHIAAGIRRAEYVDEDGLMNLNCVTPDGVSLDGVSLDDLGTQLDRVAEAIVTELGSLLTEATTVREFLSATTGRVLVMLADLRHRIRSSDFDDDDIDEIIVDLAALSGLWRESTVRGSAWRIGDTGRRLERCLVTLDLIESTFIAGRATDRGRTDSGDELDSATIEVLLDACESLVAYRRRHRSDVEAEAALQLIVTDESNPRSLAAAIGDLAIHCANGETAIGEDFTSAACVALERPVGEMVPILRQAVVEVGERVVGGWFSAPVDPVAMRMK